MKKLWQKRAIRIAVYLIAVLIIAAISIKPILRGIGRWLNATDPTEQTAMCFVLGGNSFERGLAAVELWRLFPEQEFITTGGNYPYQIMCLDTMMLECELTRHWMIHNGVPASSIDTLSSAHSTQDESNEILSWCKGHGVNNITVISSAFHMRRVRMVFEDKFDDAGIRINFHGSTAVDYNDHNWWKNEEGLIMANNELVKLFYYLFKY
jgi:uncharacterized SAM-binding protein YcdF (DUF218 family)